MLYKIFMYSMVLNCIKSLQQSVSFISFYIENDTNIWKIVMEIENVHIFNTTN